RWPWLDAHGAVWHLRLRHPQLRAIHGYDCWPPTAEGRRAACGCSRLFWALDGLLRRRVRYSLLGVGHRLLGYGPQVPAWTLRFNHGEVLRGVWGTAGAVLR